MDSDVYAEKNKIRMLSPYYIMKNNLVIKDLSKFYGKFMAVNQLCVGVDKGECFGLLGGEEILSINYQNYKFFKFSQWRWKDLNI